MNGYQKKGISSKQLAYSAALFIIASNLLTKSLYAYTKNQTWISIAMATCASFFVISIYGRLVKNHPGRTLFEINEAVFGAVGGKILSAVYVFFFLTLTVFNTRDLGSFVHSFVLPATPINVIYAVFIAVGAYAVRKGAEKMTRYGTLILFIYLILLFILSCLLIKDMHLVNFLPLFTVPLKNILLSAHIVIMLPYAEIFVFLTMSQRFNTPENAGKALRRGLAIGAATILFLVLRDIAVLGGYTLYTSSPTFNTIRLINIGDILTRLEIINAVLQITLFFFKVSILLYATTVGVGQLLGIGKYQIFTLVVGALVIVSANFLFISSGEHQQWFRAAATYGTLFLFILPLLTLIVSSFKRLNSTGQGETVRL
jgi:spore germination protein KB